MYFHGEEKSWAKLKVISLVPKNLIRIGLVASIMALYHVSFRDLAYQDIFNDVATLIDYASEKKAEMSQAEQSSVFIVTAYLWNFWQRLKTLDFYLFHDAFRQGHDLQIGYEKSLYHRSFMVSSDLSLVQLSRRHSEEGRTGNMCGWALNLTRSEPYCFGLDFRLLHHRYASVLGQEPARCRPNSSQACNGKHPKDCLRFHGAVIADQSAHDSSCRYMGQEEPKLRWNEASYLSIQGPKAVIVSATQPANGIEYCSATKRTMAISHVWSHG